MSAFYNSPLVYRGSVRRTRGLELTTSSLIFATLGNSNKLDCSRLMQKLRVSEKIIEAQIALRLYVFYYCSIKISFVVQQRLMIY